MRRYIWQEGGFSSSVLGITAERIASKPPFWVKWPDGATDKSIGVTRAGMPNCHQRGNSLRQTFPKPPCGTLFTFSLPRTFLFFLLLTQFLQRLVQGVCRLP